MKKIMTLFLALFIATNISFASDCGCPLTKTMSDMDQEKYAQKNEAFKKDNECYFDNLFKDMKEAMCLTSQQESSIDSIYDNYKPEMQDVHEKIRDKRSELCTMISSNPENCIIDKQKDELKELKREAKDQYRALCDDIEEQLCKDQIKKLHKFNSKEFSKMRKLAKYCMVPHFPCDTGCKMQSSCACK